VQWVPYLHAFFCYLSKKLFIPGLPDPKKLKGQMATLSLTFLPLSLDANVDKIDALLQEYKVSKERKFE